MGVVGKVTERLSDILRLTAEISNYINTVLTEVQQNECLINTSFGT